MGQYLQNLANGRNVSPIQQPSQVVVYQQNTDPQNCALDCTIPSVGPGTPLRTALTTTCKLVLGPFTNTATQGSPINILVGLNAFNNDKIQELINALIIPAGTYVNSNNNDFVQDAQLHFFEELSADIPYIFTNLAVRFSGASDTILENQFNQNATIVHVDAANPLTPCKTSIPAPICTPCNSNVAPTVTMFNGCALFAGAQDGIIYGVVPGATVTLEFCIEAFADINSYEQCTNPSGVATVRSM